MVDFEVVLSGLKTDFRGAGGPQDVPGECTAGPG